MSGKHQIKISPSQPVKNNPMRKKEMPVVVVNYSPLGYKLCSKKEDIKRFEETEDCFILDFDPSDLIDIAKLSVNDDNNAADLSVIAKKGQVACREYPHSRHLCKQFGFDSTPHERHCHLCYCYVCDASAPCKYWNIHCHASEHVEDWKHRRNARRSLKKLGNSADQVKISPSPPVKNNPMRKKEMPVAVDDSPLGYKLCSKKEDIKRFEETEDCFILDFDPSDLIDIAKLSVNVCSKKEDIKRFEETEDCFILDFDPFDLIDIAKLSVKVCSKKDDIKRFEETEDCFILDFDPSDSIDIAKLSINDDNNAADLSVIAEKGQVACRDYPHSRHLCVQFRFDSTPHERHCHLCYCYVCDTSAPCKDWNRHCHASEQIGDWKHRRNVRRSLKKLGNS